MDPPPRSLFSSKGSAENPKRRAKRRSPEPLDPEEDTKNHPLADTDALSSAGTDDVYQLLPGGIHLVKWAVAESLPILFQDSIYFQQSFIILNPAAPKVTSVNVRRAAMKLFGTETESLRSTLRDLNSRVSLTSGVWTWPWPDPDNLILSGLTLPYLYLSCQWIDENWEKQSRVIGWLRLDWPIEDPENVSSLIMEAVSKWGLHGKILSINFNDLTNVPDAVSQLRSSLNPMFDGQLFHSKCAYHILNSCFEDGFSMISTQLGKVRYAIDFIFWDEARTLQFKEICSQSCVRYKSLLLDSPEWFNTTYDMLDAFIRYRDQLTEYCNREFAAGTCCESGEPLTEDEWQVVCSMRDFFERFRAAFDIFCSVYVPNTNLVVPILFTLSEAFAQFRDDKHVGKFCVGLEAKFSAYWDSEGIPMVYCLATILDPRYKLAGLFKLLDAYHANMNFSIGNMKDEVQALLYRMYDAYFQQYSPPPIPEDLVRAEGSSSSGTKTAVRLARSMRMAGDVDSYSELNYYLSSNDVSSFRIEEDIDKLDMFDVLKWWKRNQVKYPVLSTMARELLAPLASAKVPDDTFDFHSPEVNNRRWEIRLETAEMCVCLKDWLRAATHAQHLFVDMYAGDVSSDEEDGENDEGEDK
ncbi:unnamed protein product [Linum trigynum]|uniref:Transposase n=2 Tax=Linum trigynum TaxID=586398 RepID=A0AAV2D955_9ROSI